MSRRARRRAQQTEAAAHDLLDATKKTAQASDGHPPITPTPKGVAQSYCTATANTFGTIALIQPMGSLNLRENTFGLFAHGAPPVPQSFGMFTFGQTQAAVPFGNGTICISPGTMQHFAPQSLNFDGTVSISMQKHPAEFSVFTPGSSWNFQLWYRNSLAANNGLPTINFSNGLHVECAP